MAEKKATIVIKKIKKGGHGGAHGGAWKVAYADFVTAMMCFFLVMWLMGSDEETKESIANYFNNPTAAWRPELKDNDTVPLGNQTGAGEALLKGADGGVPENLVDKPAPVIPPDNKARLDADGALSAEEIAQADTVSFSFWESELFPNPESTEVSRAKAQRLLKKVGKVARAFAGPMIIRGVFDDRMSDNYEFEMSRLVSLRKFMVAQKWLADDLMRTSLRKLVEDPESRKPYSTKSGNKIEFVFLK